LPAPVTRTTLPFNEVSTHSSLCCSPSAEGPFGAIESIVSDRRYRRPKRLDLPHGVHVILSNQVGEETGRIVAPIFDRGRKAEMIGTTRQNTATAVLTDQQELNDDLLPRVLRGKRVPPRETAHTEQLFSVEHDVGTADPGDLVTNRGAIRRQLFL